ncbi:MAG: M48 family metallopeptidase [Candidatus Binatia bacterium]
MSILVFILGQAVALLGGTQVHGGELARAATQKYVDAETAQRLYRITKPLLGAMDHSRGPRQVSIGIVADDAINAANGGGGKFLVTTGLLARANDEQLRGVMAHEIAHEDLGHVTKLKTSATGTNMVLLEQLATESSALTLIDGPLTTLSFTRSEELDAHRQSVAILARAGHPRAVIIETLSWLAKNSARADGFVATHSHIGERIETLKAMSR